MSMTPIMFEKGVAHLESVYQQFGERTANILRDNRVDLSPYKRVIRIVPSVDKVDLQNQKVALDFLRSQWGFYADYGNVDLDHAAAPYKSEEDAKAFMERQGYSYDANAGKAYMELGRPIVGTFDPSDCSFLAYIYAAGEDGTVHPLAEWWWSTLHTNPPRRWRASVGLMAVPPTQVVADGSDERLGISRKIITEEIREGRWFNTAMTPYPVHSHVPGIEVVKDEKRVQN
jgi:hypothetical protein